MTSLTKDDLDRLLRDSELDWELIEKQRRIFEEAEQEKQRLWAEFHQLQAQRRTSPLGGLLRRFFRGY